MTFLRQSHVDHGRSFTPNVGVTRKAPSHTKKLLRGNPEGGQE